MLVLNKIITYLFTYLFTKRVFLSAFSGYSSASSCCNAANTSSTPSSCRDQGGPSSLHRWWMTLLLGTWRWAVRLWVASRVNTTDNASDTKIGVPSRDAYYSKFNGWRIARHRMERRQPDRIATGYRPTSSNGDRKIVWRLGDRKQCKDNYSATSNNMKLVHRFVDGRAVTFGTARRGLGGDIAHPGLSSLYQM